jgi:hypothetical protein
MNLTRKVFHSMSGRYFTQCQEGISLNVRTVDLLVSAPTREAIARAIADVQWLKGYSLVDYWLPESGCLEF